VTIAFVQSAEATAGTSVTSLTCAYSSNNGSGNLLLCGVRIGGNTAATITYSDTKSNSWSAVTTQGQTTDGHEAGMGYAPNSAAGANTVTASQNGTASSLYMLIAEYSGLATSAPLDKYASAQANGVTTTTSGATGTTTNSTELLFAISTNSNTNTTAATANSFGTGSGTATIRQYASASNSYKLLAWDATTTSTGAYNASVTWPTSGNNTAIIATFLPPGVALTGQGITSAQGSFTKTAAIAMSQENATLAQGSLALTISVPLTGLQITSAQGTLATALILQHLVATFAQGSMSPGSGVTMGGLSISSAQGAFKVTAIQRTNLPTAPPTTRTINMQALSYEVDGPVRPYPIYQFSRGRTFIKRPYENPAAGEVQGATSSGGGPGL